MELHFDPNLKYQQTAIDAVCNLFHGQEINRSEFTVTLQTPVPAQMALTGTADMVGYGNSLRLNEKTMLKNLRDVQLRNGLPQSDNLQSYDFTIEMETGTGKTYVYLRSIFELNKQYGFTKFVIVVPSVAIKEGVYKSLQITADHFKQLYAGVPFTYFLYDSSKLGDVRNFAHTNTIQIMVMTVGAINKKDVNNLYKESEKTGGEAPIDLIKQIRPIVIVDEPQSVDGGLEGRGKEALNAMNPLCTLRYSATHVNDYHKIYRLDAVDAYEQKLVKQIEVASANVGQAHNKAYVRLIKTEAKRGVVSAKIEVDIETRSGAKRNEITVNDGDSLEQKTGRNLYADFRIGEINASKDAPFMELRYPGGQQFLRIGEAYGDVDLMAVQREMIRRTIREHLDKEVRLHKLGIKVLSLFFIDHVAKYREYDENGNALKGDYARIFEEEYKRATANPQYTTLFEKADFVHPVEAVHDGYFSIDKKGTWADTSENNQNNRDSAERAYNLIMKDKERLLSFDTPLKFIFSHSALREGWDSPNVFQICNLRDMNSERERRQTIGRGLRLCVNQQGERLQGFDVNTLTVIANESYESFASNLQSEIESATGIRFGIVEKYFFAAITTEGADGQITALGKEQSEALWEYLKEKKLISENGKVLDTLRRALRDGTLELPPKLNAQHTQIIENLRKVSGRLDIKDASERKSVPLNNEIYQSVEFKELWNRIKRRTTFRVEFDDEKLIRKCAHALRKTLMDDPIKSASLQWIKAVIDVTQSGVTTTKTETTSTVMLQEQDIVLPDLLTELQNRTQLTRRSIALILTGSERLNDFKLNPQQFIEVTADVINRQKNLILMEDENGIKYQQLSEDDYYRQEMFEREELTGYVGDMLLNTKKSLFTSVIFDSGVEKKFAQDMDIHEAVKLYAKLPGWFKVPTPLGSYNPDWAVLVELDGQQRLYLVVETKSSLFEEDRRSAENFKIQCGRKHFEALATGDNPVRYTVENTVEKCLDMR